MIRITAMAVARAVFWWTVASILLVLPWLFGGMGPLAFQWIIKSGWICAGCLAVWFWNCGRLHPRPTKGFWIAVACWSLLGLQVWTSIKNPSHALQPPWTTNYLVFDPIDHTEWLPRTAFWGATEREGRLYLALGLIALSGYCLGIEKRAFRRLLWLFVANVAVLAAVGIPFKYSEKPLILGTWNAPEWYFFSTFYYHNHWAAFVLLAMGAAMSLFICSRSAVVRTTLVAALVLMVVSLVVAKARLGILAAAALSLLFVAFLIRNRIFLSSKSLLGWAFVSIFLMIGGTFVIIGWTAKKSAGGRQWENLLQQNPLTTRYLILVDSLPMIAQKPGFGWGLGAYGASFQRFQRAESIVTHNNVPSRYSHPHNDWLQWLVELGVIGSVLLFFPAVHWGIKALQDLRAAVWSAPLVHSALVLMLFAVGDMAFVNRAVLVSFVVLLGVCSSKLTREPPCPAAQVKGQQNPRDFLQSTLPKGRQQQRKRDTK